jgi:glutamate synthase (ferredoxin)
MELLGWPASIPFTDGNVIGALLDRNGLRPSRYTLPKMDLCNGFKWCFRHKPEDVIQHGRLEPEKCSLLT